MARSAASKAVSTAAALDAFLHESARLPVTRIVVEDQGADESFGATAARPHPAPMGRAPTPTPSRPSSAVGSTPLWLPQSDWLHHHLIIAGAAALVERFRIVAAGAGTIPWHLDLDSLQEDWFHVLARPADRELSLAGARVLAAQLRQAVQRRHAMAVSRVGRSRACPFDLHALVPVPTEVLRLGPDHPDALAWLWQSWGTTEALRHVEVQQPGQMLAQEATKQAANAVANQATAAEATLRLHFLSADWTPWRALLQIQADWPALRFDLRPDYTGS